MFKKETGTQGIVVASNADNPAVLSSVGTSSSNPQSKGYERFLSVGGAEGFDTDRISAKSYASNTMLSDFRNKNEQVISHKTKVRPPGRIMYEWDWQIPKFDKAFPPPTAAVDLSEKGSLGRRKTLTSKKVVAGGDIGRKSEWYFQLCEFEGKLSWYVVLGKVCKKDSTWIHVAFTLTVAGKNGKELIVKKRCFRDFQEEYKYGWDDILELGKLYDQKDVYLIDGTLKFQVLFEIFSSHEQSQKESLKQERNDFANLMTADMWRLRKSYGTADVHLDCQGKVFPVHKLILSARSATFAKIFEVPVLPKRHQQTQLNQNFAASGDKPPEEQTVASVSVPDVESPILEIILEYIYSGNVKPLADLRVLTGVVRAADKFELSDLKAFCFNALMKFANEDTIGGLAVLAHRHNAEKGVKMNIDGYCLRNLTTLMRKKSFRDSLKEEPDAFFPDDEI